VKLEKKYLVAGAIGLVTVTGALMYLQYKRLMNYVIKVKRVVVNRIDSGSVDLNLFLNFTNNSDIGFTIESQSHNIYINDTLVSKIENNTPNQILPKSTSVIGVNIKFNPNKIINILGKNIVDFLTSSDKLRIKIDMKFRVKLWFFKVNIPYVYETTLKDLLNTKKEK
jgi:LEA14-like dessication related protein